MNPRVSIHDCGKLSETKRRVKARYLRLGWMTDLCRQSKAGITDLVISRCMCTKENGVKNLPISLKESLILRRVNGLERIRR